MREKLIAAQFNHYSDSLILEAVQAVNVIRDSITMQRYCADEYEYAINSKDLDMRSKMMTDMQTSVLRERERVFEAAFLLVSQYPEGFLYLCNWDNIEKVYKNMGYRYGLDAHQYISCFGTVNCAGWLHPNSRSSNV